MPMRSTFSGGATGCGQVAFHPAGGGFVLRESVGPAQEAAVLVGRDLGDVGDVEVRQVQAEKLPGLGP